MKIAHLCAVLALACTALFVSAAPAPAGEPASAEWHAPTHPICVGPDGLERECVTLTSQPIVIDGEVHVPWGDWLSEAMKAFLIGAGALALWVLRKMPAAAVAAIDMFAGMLGQGRANELLEKAITYGVNTTAGAVKGRTMSAKIGNEVLERAFEYALRHAPGLIGKLGGLAQLREKIIARLDLEESAAVPAPRPPAENLISAPPATPSAP